MENNEETAISTLHLIALQEATEDDSTVYFLYHYELQGIPVHDGLTLTADLDTVSKMTNIEII